MMKSLLLAAALMATAVQVYSQVSHTVDVTNNVFTPDEITITVGDTVVWTNSQGFHNVNGEQATYPDNPESFGNSTGSGWVFSHVFTLPGTYDYQCDPHVGFGMVGKVIVEAAMDDFFTINFSGMDPHVGQLGWVIVYDPNSGDVIERSSGLIEEANFSLELNPLPPGGDFTVDILADLNQNGYYDAPPADHAWRFQIENATSNQFLDVVHNLEFTDIAFEHLSIMDLTGMSPHAGQDMKFALVDVMSEEIVQEISLVAGDSFMVELGPLVPGKAYYVDFYADFNENSMYDAPPVDHAWRHEITEAMGDDSLTFVHNTDFTDVASTFGSDPTSTGNFESLSVNVYPNPASGQVIIRSDKEILSVSLISITGQKVRMFEGAEAQEWSLDLSGILPGTYLLESVSREGYRQSTRLMIW